MTAGDANRLPDPASPIGRRARERLRDDVNVWLITVGADGTPHPNPVWFWWDGETILLYSLPDAHRIANIRRQPRVSLHFDSDGGDGDVVIITGRAQVDLDAPPADAVPGFIAKYEKRMVNIPPAKWASTFSLPVRIRLEKVRGWGPPRAG